MDIILLENISRLGSIGDVVGVKNGFARNYLIPEGKALRANKANKEVFETRRSQLESQNNDRKTEAETQAKTLDGAMVTVIRQASDDGKLYGSVAVRDVSDALAEEGHTVDRRLIDLNATIKNLGLYDVSISLHPDVVVTIKVHVARNADSPIPQELVEEEAAPVEIEAAAHDENDEAAPSDATSDDEDAA